MQQQPISDLRWEELRDVDNSTMLALPRLIPPTQDAPQKKKLLSHSRERLALPPVAPTMAAATSSSTTLLRFPTLVKPEHRRIVQPLRSISSCAQVACNQEENEPTQRHANGGDLNNNELSDDDDDATRSASRLRRAVSDKNRDFIKELEEKKRRERDEQVRRATRKQKLQEKLSRKILQEAASARQRQHNEPEEPEMDAEQQVTTDRQSGEDSDGNDRDVASRAARRKEKAKRQKRLLAKQQAHLEQIQTKQREKLEEVERERARERRKQARIKKSMLDAIYEANGRWNDNLEDDIAESTFIMEENSLDPEPSLESNESEPGSPVAEEEDLDLESQSTSAAAGSAMALLRERKEAARSDSATEKPKPQRNREQRDAVHRKQQEYLLKLTEQRKQKQRNDEDALALQEKRKRKAQQEAFIRLQEAALRQQQLQKTKEEEEAAATAAKLSAAAPPIDVEAMVARLSKLKDRDKEVIPEARDFVSWKKRHGVPMVQKVFCMTGWYPVIRAELEARGWVYNPERNSPFFDLKWSLKSDDLKGCKLEKHQYVNHFFQNTAITTKVGLLHNLRNLMWHQSLDVHTLFPRAYDLNEPRDMEMFVQDFRYGVAEGLLKELAKRGLQKPPEVATQRLNAGVVAVLMNIGRKKLKSVRSYDRFTQGDNEDVFSDELEESVDNPLSSGAEELVTDLEWEVLTRCPLNQVGLLRASIQYKKKTLAEDRTDALLDGNNGSTIVDTVLSAFEKKQQRAVEKQRMDAFNREKARLSELVARLSPLSPDALQQLIGLVLSLEKTCPQFHINGGGDLYGVANLPSAIPSVSKNVWIVKPAGMSRGRGIRVFNDLERLLEYADVENHKECQWVAQKYIENPLLVCKRKFDIRQWVLVTSWDPLTVWFYEDCYLRFSSQEFSMDDLSDQYVHLTNNSIQKYSDTFHEVYGTDDGGTQVEGNMWHSDDFKHYIRTTLKQPDAWDARVHPRMKEIVVASLQCVQDMVQHRKNCCELYGYDFMLDHSLVPWLIEVNSSPACDYSTPTAKRYVETGLAGIVKVIVDHREYEHKKKHDQALTEGEPSTGCWQRIHKAEYIGQPVSSFGADFQVRGAKVQKSRRAARNTTTATSAPPLKASTQSSSAAAWTGSEGTNEDKEDKAAAEDEARAEKDRASTSDDDNNDDADSLL